MIIRDKIANVKAQALEAEIHQQLVALGWTPPGEGGPVDRAVFTLSFAQVMRLMEIAGGSVRLRWKDGAYWASRAEPEEGDWVRLDPPEGAAFTKKPVQVRAIQWTGGNLREVIAFTGKHPRWNEWFSTWEDYERRVQQDGGVLKITTLEGTMEAAIGDWVIRGVKGEHYPCKPDVFTATYEPAK